MGFRKLIALLVLSTAWAAGASQNDASALCPETIRVLKSPLPATPGLYKSDLEILLKTYSKPREGATQADLFCADAREKAIQRLMEGASSEILDLPEVQVLVGEYQFLGNHLESARDAFYRAHQANPKELWPALRLAEIARRLSQPDAERAYLEIALEQKSKDPKIEELQKQAYLRYVSLLPKSKAETFIRKTWAKNYPSDYRRAVALCRIAENTRDPKLLMEAVDLIGHLAPDQKTSSLTTYYRGEAYYLKQDYAHALEDFQAFLKNTPRVQDRDQDAVRLLLESADHVKDKRAIAVWLQWAFGKGWLKEPRFLKMHEDSISWENMSLDELKKAMAYHETSLKIESYRVAKTMVMWDNKRIELPQVQIAVDNLEMDFPDSIEALYYRGRVLRAQGKFSAAQPYFQRVREQLGPTSAFFDNSIRNDFLARGSENLLSLGRDADAHEWAMWALKTAGLPKDVADYLQALTKRSSKAGL